MNISKTVLNAVAQMTREELLALNEVVINTVNAQQRAKNSNAKCSFMVGDPVKFSGRRGPVEGIVKKINAVNIVVRANKTNVQWSVSPSLLSKV
jgi:hypothetical protein